LKSTRDGAFRCLDDIVLRESQCCRLVWIRTCNGKECAKKFDAIGDRVGSHEREPDDRDNGVEEDEGGPVVDLIGPEGCAEGHQDCQHIWWGNQQQSDRKRETKVEENNGNEISESITRCCGAEELA